MAPVGPLREAPDWDPDASRACGAGLHGLLWGVGDGNLLDWSPDARWLVVAVDPADIAALHQPSKVRYRRGEVVHLGDQQSAVAYLVERGAGGLPVVGGTSTSGYRGTSTSGDGGTSTSGYRGTSTSGDRGTSTSGYRGTSTSGFGGTIVVSWLDGDHYRLLVGAVGEDGVQPNTAYCVQDGRFVEAEVVGQ